MQYKLNGHNDVMLAFGLTMSLLTVWSFCNIGRDKDMGTKAHRDLHDKLDRILAKLGA